MSAQEDGPMNEDFAVDFWWMEHPRLKGVRSVVLVESLYDVDGDLVGGGFYSAGVVKIGCPASSLECQER